MTDAITRERIQSRLGNVTYDRFLLYLMGPYKSFNLNYVLDEEERAEIDLADLPGPLRRLFRNRDRIVFVHEDDVTSEMIRSARTRWDLRVETYGTTDELVGVVRRFVVTVMNRERFGDLEYLG